MTYKSILSTTTLILLASCTNIEKPPTTKTTPNPACAKPTLEEVTIQESTPHTWSIDDEQNLAYLRELDGIQYQVRLLQDFKKISQTNTPTLLPLADRKALDITYNAFQLSLKELTRYTNSLHENPLEANQHHSHIANTARKKTQPLFDQKRVLTRLLDKHDMPTPNSSINSTQTLQSRTAHEQKYLTFLNNKCSK